MPKFGKFYSLSKREINPTKRKITSTIGSVPTADIVIGHFVSLLKRSLRAHLALAALVALGCATTLQPIKLTPGTTAAVEVSGFERDIAKGYEGQFDVLAEPEFAQARRYLKDAQEHQNLGRKSATILDDVAYGRAYFNEAKRLADSRRTKIEGVLQARADALAAGVRDGADTAKQFKKLDNELRSMVGDLDREMTPPVFSKLQAGYLGLEVRSITRAEIGQAQGSFRSVNDGDRYAPKTYRQADQDLRNAENLISANHSDPQAYRPAVARANESVKLLTEVMALTTRRDSPLSEEAALKEISLSREVRNLKGQLGQAQTKIGNLGKALNQKEEALASAQKQIDLQSAIERAQNELEPNEAEAYQQGDTLLIRLKAMNFPSGSSDLPPKSLALLAKVKEILSDLKPKAVVVEGHTDSVGSPELNRKLSQARADAVAEYLQTTGLTAEKIEATGEGFDKPIAPNKSKVGRAQNRRVDIIVTPSERR